MGLGRKTCMIMHGSIRSDNDQSSRRRFKAIEITICYKNVFRAIVGSFSTASTSYLYLEEIRHK